MASKFERGSIVVVRAYGGEKLPRRVVADLGRSVVICTEQEYIAAVNEQREPEGVGFPRTAVTAYPNGGKG